MKKVNLRKEKIKYVAIGDSISEGYNARFNFGYAGGMDEKGKIYGLSWPSFFARHLQKIDKNCLESFHNFAMSGTRPEDWNYFLGVQKNEYNYKNSEKKINFSLLVNQLKDNPERNRLKKQFKNFGKVDINDFNFLIKQIQNANLITINIGANYLIPKAPIVEIVNWILKEKKSKQEIMKHLDSIITSLEIHLIDLFGRLKELNPSASIYALSYNRMFGPFWEIISDFFKDLGLIDDIIDYVCSKTNLVIQNCAKKAGIYFISTDNKLFWNENSYQLSNVFYEIHPTIYGYKKISQDVFAKICFSNDFWKDNNIPKRIKSFNYEYLLLDKKSFSNGIDFKSIEIDDDFLIHNIFGINDELLFQSNEEDISNFLEKELYVEQYLDRNNDPNNSIRISLQNSIFTILNLIGVEINTEIQENIKFFFNIDHEERFIIKNGFASNIANKIQKRIDQYYLKSFNSKLTKSEFIEICLEELFDPIFILKWVKKNAQYLLEKQKAINKNLISKTINTILKTRKIKNLFVLTISNATFDILKNKFNILLDLKIIKNFVETLFDNINFDEFSSIVLSFYFNSLDRIRKIRSFDNLIKLFFSDTKIKEFLLQNIDRILKTFDFASIFTKLIFIKSRITKNKFNEKKLRMFFDLLIQYIEKNNYIWEVVTNLLLETIKYNKNNNHFIQLVTDYLFSLDKKQFWDNLAKIDFNKLSNEEFDSVVYSIDLMVGSWQANSLFFNSILNLSNPKNYLNENKKIRPIFLIKYLDKIMTLKKPFNLLQKRLLDKYYISTIKTKDNIYYKTFFRIMFLVLLFARQLFQKNLSKNIFMNKRNSIVKFVFGLVGYSNGKNKGIDNLLLNMFNENNNYYLEMKHNSSTNKNRPLLLIFDFDLEEKFRKNKEKKILDILKDGFAE